MPRRVSGAGIGRTGGAASLSKVSGIAPSSFLRVPNVKAKITVSGVSAVESAFRKVSRNMESATFKAVEAAVKMIRAEARKIVLTGSMKAYDTGELYEGIVALIEERNNDEIYGVAGTFTVKHAIYIHEGTHKMAPRPFLLVAIKRRMKLIEKMIQQAVQRDISRGFISV